MRHCLSLCSSKDRICLSFMNKLKAMIEIIGSWAYVLSIRILRFLRVNSRTFIILPSDHTSRMPLNLLIVYLIFSWSDLFLQLLVMNHYQFRLWQVIVRRHSYSVHVEIWVCFLNFMWNNCWVGWNTGSSHIADQQLRIWQICSSLLLDLDCIWYIILTRPWVQRFLFIALKPSSVIRCIILRAFEHMTILIQKIRVLSLVYWGKNKRFFNRRKSRVISRTRRLLYLRHSFFIRHKPWHFYSNLLQHFMSLRCLLRSIRAYIIRTRA